MKTFIISTGLEYYKKNFEECVQSCIDNGVEYEVAIGVLPDMLQKYEEEFPYTVKDNNAKPYDDQSRRVKKACFYSHFLLWHKAVELNEPIVILEEDTEVVKPFDFDYFRSKLNDKGMLFLKVGNITGCGYVITPGAARGAIDIVEKIGWMVNDKHLNKCQRRHRNVDQFWVDEDFVKENELIGKTERAKGSLINHLSGIE